MATKKTYPNKKLMKDPEFLALVKQARRGRNDSDFGQVVGIHQVRIRELEEGRGDEPTPAERRRIETAAKGPSVLS